MEQAGERCATTQALVPHSCLLCYREQGARLGGRERLMGPGQWVLPAEMSRGVGRTQAISEGRDDQGRYLITEERLRCALGHS